MVALGCNATDKITGFTGTVTGRTEYLSGCARVLVEAKLKKDGSAGGNEWFDEQRLTVDSSVPLVVLENRATPGPDKPAPKR